jgi:hypothetical protein
MNRPKKDQVRRTLPPRAGEIPGAVQRMETVPFTTVQCQEQDRLWEAYSRLVHDSPCSENAMTINIELSLMRNIVTHNESEGYAVSRAR